MLVNEFNPYLHVSLKTKCILNVCKFCKLYPCPAAASEQYFSVLTILGLQYQHISYTNRMKVVVIIKIIIIINIIICK